MSRSVVLCPGRGSYAKDTLGYLTNLSSPKLDIADALRKSLQRPTIREMDASEKFRSSWHIAGENASLLTAGISAADFDQISNDHNIVGVCGNSMGWYTALGLANACSFEAAARLIETMGQYQKRNIIGGQIVYPLVREDWTIDTERLAIVEQIIQTTPDCYWSIRLGGQAIIGGSKEALEQVLAALPEVTQGSRTFPFMLPLHSAFHTPLMMDTRHQAEKDLAKLELSTPDIPLIDGQGHIWRPKACDPHALKTYTLGKQVTDVYDFTAMIKSVLKQFAPDHIILLGPGSNLGSAVAHVLIQEGWQGIRSKADFLQRQKENPFVLAMGRTDQRHLVV